MLFTRRLLSGVRSARRNSTELRTFRVDFVSSNGQVITMAPDGCAWIDSVCARLVEERKCIVCATLVVFGVHPFAAVVSKDSLTQSLLTMLWTIVVGICFMAV